MLFQIPLVFRTEQVYTFLFIFTFNVITKKRFSKQCIFPFTTLFPTCFFQQVKTCHKSSRMYFRFSTIWDFKLPIVIEVWRVYYSFTNELLLIIAYHNWFTNLKANYMTDVFLISRILNSGSLRVNKTYKILAWIILYSHWKRVSNTQRYQQDTPENRYAVTKVQHAREVRNKRRQGEDRVSRDFSEEVTCELVRNSVEILNMKGMNWKSSGEVFAWHVEKGYC